MQQAIITCEHMGWFLALLCYFVAADLFCDNFSFHFIITIFIGNYSKSCRNKPNLAIISSDLSSEIFHKESVSLNLFSNFQIIYFHRHTAAIRLKYLLFEVPVFVNGLPRFDLTFFSVLIYFDFGSCAIVILQFW